MPFNPTRLKRVVVLMEEKKHREFKHKAIDLGVNLSEYLRVAGTIADQSKIKKAVSQVGVPPQN